MIIAIGGCPSGGGGSTMCWSPQERLLVSLKDFNRAEIGFNFLIFSRSRKNIFCIVTILKKPQGKDTIAPRFF
jgi:hypothetical protein